MIYGPGQDKIGAVPTDRTSDEATVQLTENKGLEKKLDVATKIFFVRLKRP